VELISRGVLVCRRVRRALEGGAGREDPLEPRVWAAVRSMSSTVPEEQRLVHGDFWPGNKPLVNRCATGASGISSLALAPCATWPTGPWDIAPWAVRI